MIAGCCTGLVCATSTINPTYGVCVAGEGGMLPVSDSLIVPTEGIEEELAQAVSEASADSTAAQSALTTEESDRQAKIDAKRAKKDTRRSTRRSKNDTQQSTRRTNRATRRTTQELNAGPELEVALFEEEPPEAAEAPAAVDPLDTPPEPEADEPVGRPEMVRIRNHDTVSVVLSGIESITDPDLFETFTITIAAGDTHLLLSGQYAEEARKTLSGATVWTEETLFPSQATLPPAKASPDGQAVRRHAHAPVHRALRGRSAPSTRTRGPAGSASEPRPTAAVPASAAGRRTRNSRIAGKPNSTTAENTGVQVLCAGGGHQAPVMMRPVLLRQLHRMRHLLTRGRHCLASLAEDGLAWMPNALIA